MKQDIKPKRRQIKKNYFIFDNKAIVTVSTDYLREEDGIVDIPQIDSCIMEQHELVGIVHQSQNVPQPPHSFTPESFRMFISEHIYYTYIFEGQEIFTKE